MLSNTQKEIITEAKSKTDFFTFYTQRVTKIVVFAQSFSKPDNLWNIVKISQSGQSVGGQTEGNDCKFSLDSKYN